MVRGFLPITSRFAFPNAFPRVPVRRIGIPGVVSVRIGDASNGLCGGMAFGSGLLRGGAPHDALASLANPWARTNVLVFPAGPTVHAFFRVPYTRAAPPSHAP